MLSQPFVRQNVLRMFKECFKMFLNVVSVDDFLISHDSLFSSLQSSEAATLKARSPNLSLVRGTTITTLIQCKTFNKRS